MDGIAGIADGFDDELRFDPLGLLSKEEHPGQIQHTVICGQIHVSQER